GQRFDCTEHRRLHDRREGNPASATRNSDDRWPAGNTRISLVQHTAVYLGLVARSCRDARSHATGERVARSNRLDGDTAVPGACGSGRHGSIQGSADRRAGQCARVGTAQNSARHLRRSRGADRACVQVLGHTERVGASARDRTPESAGRLFRAAGVLLLIVVGSGVETEASHQLHTSCPDWRSMSNRFLIAVVAATALTAPALHGQGSISSQGLGYPPGELSTRALGTAGAIGEIDARSPINPAALAIRTAPQVYAQYDPEFRTITSNGQSS